MHLNSPMDNPPAGCLYVVATPIGNLEDITLRAIKTLEQADLIAAEDTRRTRKLLSAYNIDRPLISYHEHNEKQRTPALLEKLTGGACIALVSDAGTPTVSDPGYRLIAAAADRGIAVIPIPGVSAAMTALSASGLATDSFTFVGFPARKKAKRRQQLMQLATVPHTLIFYQSPRRMVSFLEEVLDVLGDRTAVLGRELTKLHEEFLRGCLSGIREQLAQRPEVKGECTLLVSGAEMAEPAGHDLDGAIEKALARSDQSLGDLSKDLARRFGVSRKQVYSKALAMKEKP